MENTLQYSFRALFIKGFVKLLVALTFKVSPGPEMKSI